VYKEISAPLISGALGKMHHNMLVSPLGLFQFNIVCVRSGTLPLTSVCFFHVHFQLPDLHEESCFQEKIRQAILGYANQRKGER
jgi:hypothetical protein